MACGTKNDAFAARFAAIDAILQDAAPHALLTLCARALAEVTPTCCEAHQNELKAEFLRVLNDGVAILREQDAAEAAEGTDVHPPQVHWGRGHERSLRH